MSVKTKRKIKPQGYHLPYPFQLESGEKLPEVKIAYETWGHINSSRDNVILVCHALTGDSHAHKTGRNSLPGWWDGIIGPGKALDTNKNFIICSNILGSCYGSTGPTSINPITGQEYRMDFPQITVRDMVKLQYQLIKYLGINSLKTVIGGSLGGMQVLEWAVSYPEIVGSIIPIATDVQHSPWAIGFNKAARQAITNDPTWNNGDYEDQPTRGLNLARVIAMLSYRTRPNFGEKFGRELCGEYENYYDYSGKPKFQVESYLKYQGEKLVNRFDANTYLYLTRALDLFDLSRGRGSISEVLGGITADTLSIGISSDILYPPDDQKCFTEQIPNAKYKEIESIHGHDGFLIENEQLRNIVNSFLE